MIPEIHINLSLPPEKRWTLQEVQRQQAADLLQSYLADLQLDLETSSLLMPVVRTLIKPNHLAEIDAIAGMLHVRPDEALLGNLYYDAIKFVFGCTAFAVDTESGPLHARNLDWWTENEMLSRYTLVSRFSGASPGRSFVTVGWPGFVGALSGIAPGRFAITLNAVLSTDPPALGTPISLFIRTVLEEAATFAEAVEWLAREPLASDCLLLVSGTQTGEMVVIERTPTRSAIRHPENGYIVVTNDYLLIDADPDQPATALQATSCNRFDQATARLGSYVPHTQGECLAILSDPQVRMSITVQQMVFSARTGQLEVRLP